MTKTMVEEHPELFHYTSAADLQGLLRSQTLWATHAEYLNDAAEIESVRASITGHFETGGNERHSQSP